MATVRPPSTFHFRRRMRQRRERPLILVFLGLFALGCATPDHPRPGPERDGKPSGEPNTTVDRVVLDQPIRARLIVSRSQAEADRDREPSVWGEPAQGLLEADDARREDAHLFDTWAER